jgi:hypothetical protein
MQAALTYGRRIVPKELEKPDYLENLMYIDEG